MWLASFCSILIIAQVTAADSSASATSLPPPPPSIVIETPAEPIPTLGQEPQLYGILPSEDLAWPEDAAWSDDSTPLPATPLPATQLSTTFLPDLGSDGFGVNSFDLRHTLLLGYDENPPLNITPGAAMHAWSGPRELDLPPRVYDLYLDLQWQPWQSEKSALLLGATPGLYGDFERVDSTTFQWSGWLLGSRRVGQRWTLLGGVAYLRRLRSNWLPIGGAVWAVNDRTRLELLFPRPKLTRLCYADDEWTYWAYVAGQFGGGAWSVADTPEENVLVGYSDLRLLGGCEAFSVSGYEWRAEMGYVFDRQLSVNSTPLVTPSGTLLAQFTLAF